jgi:branched-subunit amino acid ABC-type transport system permease component
MVGAYGWPYGCRWRSPSSSGHSSALIEVTVIRRLFKAPRVIVLVATIGVAQLCEAVTLALPGIAPARCRRSSRCRSAAPASRARYRGHCEPGAHLIVVPLITLGLWWLLGHTAFGARFEPLRPTRISRMTGINPKMVSTGVWAIAGFLATMAVFLTATDTASADLVHIGPDTLLRGMAAALIGG